MTQHRSYAAAILTLAFPCIVLAKLSNTGRAPNSPADPKPSLAEVSPETPDKVSPQATDVGTAASQASTNATNVEYRNNLVSAATQAGITNAKINALKAAGAVDPIDALLYQTIGGIVVNKTARRRPTQDTPNDAPAESAVIPVISAVNPQSPTPSVSNAGIHPLKGDRRIRDFVYEKTGQPIPDPMAPEDTTKQAPTTEPARPSTGTAAVPNEQLADLGKLPSENSHQAQIRAVQRYKRGISNSSGSLYETQPNASPQTDSKKERLLQALQAINKLGNDSRANDTARSKSKTTALPSPTLPTPTKDTLALNSLKNLLPTFEQKLPPILSSLPTLLANQVDHSRKAVDNTLGPGRFDSIAALLAFLIVACVFSLWRQAESAYKVVPPKRKNNSPSHGTFTRQKIAPWKIGLMILASAVTVFLTTHLARAQDFDPQSFETHFNRVLTQDD